MAWVTVFDDDFHRADGPIGANYDTTNGNGVGVNPGSVTQILDNALVSRVLDSSPDGDNPYLAAILTEAALPISIKRRKVSVTYGGNEVQEGDHCAVLLTLNLHIPNVLDFAPDALEYDHNYQSLNREVYVFTNSGFATAGDVALSPGDILSVEEDGVGNIIGRINGVSFGTAAGAAAIGGLVGFEFTFSGVSGTFSTSLTRFRVEEWNDVTVPTAEESRTKMYACIRSKLAAWASWKFSGQLRGMSVLTNTLVLTIQRNDKVFVETMELDPSRSTRHLDCELLNADLTITVTTGVTKWTFPFDITADPDFPMTVLNLDTGLEITTLPRTDDGFIEATGNFSTVNVAVGLAFPVEWQLSDIYITDPQNDGSVIGFTDGRLQIRYIEFAYDHTGEFDVTVTPNVDDPTLKYTYTFSGTNNNVKGIYRVPVQGQNTKCKVVIGGTSARPFDITSFTWTGYLSQKTKRV